MRNHNKMSWNLCIVEPQKQATSGLQKKWREFRPCRSHFFEAKRPHSTQRVREEYRKIGESSVYANGCFLVCTGCTVRSRCESCQKKWRAFRPYKWLFCTMLRPHSTQRARKLPGKELRELRPCRMCSMQLTQELSQKNGESSVHANRDFSYLRRQTLRFISIRQRKHKA